MPKLSITLAIEQFLKAWQGMEMTLVLDTSVLWDKYCLIEVCLIWGVVSIPLGQSVLEHGSATVGYEDYRPQSWKPHCECCHQDAK